MPCSLSWFSRLLFTRQGNSNSYRIKRKHRIPQCPWLNDPRIFNIHRLIPFSLPLPEAWFGEGWAGKKENYLRKK